MIWLVVVVTDDGAEVQSVHSSREQALLHRHSAHMRVVPLDSDACARLAEEHGMVVEPDHTLATDVLPDVWTET